MPTDDDTPPEHAVPPLPPFVPTLTEVVQADGEPEAAPGPASDTLRGDSAPAAAPPPAASALVTADELLARLGPDLDRLIGEAVGRLLHEQMLGFNARVQKTVAEVVREAVAKALVHGQLPTTDPGENP